MSDTAPRKRRRAKIACEPCRDRKRKCDGRQPCGACVQGEYDCFYHGTLKVSRLASHDVSNPRPLQQHFPRPHKSQDNSHSDLGPSSIEAAAGDEADETWTHGHAESLEANCGAAFVRKLGLQVDPQNAPRLHLFAWNTGERLVACLPGAPRPIMTMLSHASMTSLANVYFQKVAVVYGILDRDKFFHRLDERWRSAATLDPFDKVLCGVAALGMHFSQKRPPSIEPDIVETARSLLEQDSLTSPPSIDTVTGWVLRVAYLRMTSLPHPTWLASCTLMHVVEAANIHQETPYRSIFSGSSDIVELDTRRRIWGISQHLNTWASYDLGRTKITLSNSSTKTVAPRPGDSTPNIVSLISLTEALDPNESRSVQLLEADLAWLLDQTWEESPLVMAQVNLLLCIFRRLRAHNANAIVTHMDSILDLAVQGLRAAEKMMAQYCPWHHAANIPFQVICLLLAVDSPRSLTLLHEALSVLKQVKDIWDSAVMREAYDTAHLLVLLHRRRKEQDVKTLRDALGMGSLGPVPASETVPTQHAGFDSGMQPPLAGSAELPWLENLISDTPGLRDFDLQQFLVQDAPLPYDGDAASFPLNS